MARSAGLSHGSRNGRTTIPKKIIGKTVTVRACPGKGGLPKGAAETVKVSDDREIVVGRKRYYGEGPAPSDIDKDPVN